MPCDTVVCQSVDLSRVPEGLLKKALVSLGVSQSSITSYAGMLWFRLNGYPHWIEGGQVKAEGGATVDLVTKSAVAIKKAVVTQAAIFALGRQGITVKALPGRANTLVASKRR